MQERNKLIVQDYLAGLTRQELCDKYNMSCVGRVLKESGIKFGKKGGNRKRKILEADRLWIDKQIIALLKQAWTTPEIMKRYNVTGSRIARLKRQAKILTGKRICSSEAKNISEIPSMGDTLIPYADNCTVKAKRYSDHYSQIIYR